MDLSSKRSLHFCGTPIALKHMEASWSTAPAFKGGNFVFQCFYAADFLSIPLQHYKIGGGRNGGKGMKGNSGKFTRLTVVLVARRLTVNCNSYSVVLGRYISI